LQYIVSDCIHGRALHSTNYMFCKTTMICLQQLRRESFVVYSVHSSDFLQRFFSDLDSLWRLMIKINVFSFEKLSKVWL